jgi:hypothetical protein
VRGGDLLALAKLSPIHDRDQKDDVGEPRLSGVRR